MTYRLQSVFVGTLAILGAIGSAALFLPRATAFTTGLHSLMVQPNEYPEVERQALLGSEEAAERIANMNFITARFSEAIFWGSIAVENGSQAGIYNLAYVLAESPDPKQRLRARFWLMKSIEAGGKTGKLATGVLLLLDQREAEKNHVYPLADRYPKWPTE